MAIYEYTCEKCNTTVEVIQRYDDPAPLCNVCGGELKKLISKSSFYLIGGGWADDGYSKTKKKRAK